MDRQLANLALGNMTVSPNENIGSDVRDQSFITFRGWGGVMVPQKLSVTKLHPQK